MSQPEGKAAELPPSGDSETSSNSPTASEAQQLETFPLAGMHPAETKRYTPPKADAKTFPSQQAFLESLMPISIRDVEADKRKCPICWKPFGEDPDPGFDNSELPVKLHCNHVFGHKCLATIFGVRSHPRVRLEPLSFESSTKGLLLGTKLHAYVMKHGPNFRSDFETFESMMQKFERPNQPCELLGNELFGHYWWSILREAFREGDVPSLVNITIMENALVLDHRRVKQEQYTADAHVIHPHFLSPSSSGMDQTLIQPDVVPITSSQWASHHISPSPILNTAASFPDASPLWIQLDSLATASHHSKASGSTQSDSNPSGTWQVNLANETNLDKLSALQKQKVEKDKIVTAEVAAPLGKMSEYAQNFQTQLILQRTTGHERHRKLIAQRLVDVYSQYRKAQPQATNGLTSGIHPRIIRTSKTVHSMDFQITSYEMSPPIAGPNFGDEEDSDGDEDVLDGAGATFVLVRTICSSCSETKHHHVPADLPTPTELWWASHKISPDNCPMCHRILFIKNMGRD